MGKFSESKITIRCALQSFSDKTVVCPHDWTVLRLKEHLRNVFESEPDPKRQRLIYSGQCLQDSSEIGKVLRLNPEESDQIHVFHLVYTPTVEELRKKRQIDAAATAKNTAVASANNCSSRQSHATVPPVETCTNNTGDVRNRFLSHSHQIGVASQGMAQAGILPHAGFQGVAAPNFDPTNPGQYWAQMQQQMYSAYMTNYMTYMNQMYSAMYGAGVPMAAAAGVIPQFGVAAGLTVAEQRAVNTNNESNEVIPPVNPQLAQNRQQQENNGQQAPAAMNAQGGVDDEEMRERDWLDWIYMGSRAGLLVMILYFYSSVERFIFVVLCIVVMYAYNGGWFSLRNNNNQAGQVGGNNNVDMGENDDVNNEQPEQREARADIEPLGGEGDRTSSEEEELAGDAAPPATEPPPPSAVVVFFATCYTFITTFFTSLIPERPPPINLN